MSYKLSRYSWPTHCLPPLLPTLNPYCPASTSAGLGGLSSKMAQTSISKGSETLVTMLVLVMVALSVYLPSKSVRQEQRNTGVGHRQGQMCSSLSCCVTAALPSLMSWSICLPGG